MRYFHCQPFISPIERSVATIGNFDGMHLGHQQILQQLKNIAQKLTLPTTVILFEPQPQEFFLKDQAPARLQRLSDKLVFLKAAGIDQVVCLRFNQQIAGLTPQQFVEQILLQQLAVKALLIGEDFRFGKNRQGDINYLQHHHTQLAVHVIQDVCRSQVRISSTRIRELLSHAAFIDVTDLLGRPYRLTGKVIHGAKRGRQLNFPTANIPLLRIKSPLHGVYAVKVTLPDAVVAMGVANIGYRPTMHQGGAWYLEVHLFNDVTSTVWDLYSQRLQVEFVQKIRDEMRFTSLDELQAQIGADVITAKQMLQLL
jgi:riboflavin kinase/FMN adenylyltransferase